MKSAVWWSVDRAVGYVGLGPDGLEFRRHSDWYPRRDVWYVSVTGWSCFGYQAAVMDDFGNLVRVPE